MLKRILCGATLLCAAGFSSAGVVVQDFTVDRQKTAFTETINFNLFDDMGGTRVLESVEFTLLARSSGSARVENLNATPTNITATLSTDITLSDLISGLLAEAAPSLSRMDRLAGYDGNTDFDGPSGVEFLNLMTNDSAGIIIVDPISLMGYIGMGTSTATFGAMASSDVSGGGNLISNFNTFASGDVGVIYTFRDASISVSEPTQVALLGLGLLALAGFRKVKK